MTLEVIEGGARQNVGFIDTPTSRLIRAAILRVRERREPSLVIGPPGIGKTHTINEIRKNDHLCAYVLASPATKGVKAFLSSTAEAFSMPFLNGHAADIQEVLMSSRYPMDYYLVIDEAQNLDLDTFRTALSLNDVRKLGVAFVGNPETLKRRGTKTAAFNQISDRLNHRVEISSIVREDIVAFGAAHNVDGQAAYDFILRFGLSTTSLRQLEVLLNEARLVAGSNGSIKLKHLTEALTLLRGEDVAKKYLQPRFKKAPIDHRQRHVD